MGLTGQFLVTRQNASTRLAVGQQSVSSSALLSKPNRDTRTAFPSRTVLRCKWGFRNRNLALPTQHSVLACACTVRSAPEFPDTGGPVVTNPRAGFGGYAKVVEQVTHPRIGFQIDPGKEHPVPGEKIADPKCVGRVAGPDRAKTDKFGDSRSRAVAPPRSY